MPTKKCKHPNILIEEHVQRLNVSIRHNGVFQDVTGPDDSWYLFVECKDCKLNKKYYADNVPKWLQKLLVEANEQKA